MATWIVLVLLALCFGLLVQQYFVAAKYGAIGLAQAAACKRNLKHLTDRHSAGLIAMVTGAGCYLLLPAAPAHWLQLRFNDDYGVITVVLAFAAFILSYVLGHQTKQYSNSIFSYNQVKSYLLLRVLFLLVYEVFFRIALLGAALQFLPAPAAVLHNVVLYVWAHLFSPRREAVLSIPFGFLLCWLTLVHQSVWPAAIVHLMLSLPFETLVITHRKKEIHAYVS